MLSMKSTIIFSIGIYSSPKILLLFELSTVNKPSSGYPFSKVLGGSFVGNWLARSGKAFAKVSTISLLTYVPAAMTSRSLAASGVSY
jgi:hypothetical protein